MRNKKIRSISQQEYQEWFKAYQGALHYKTPYHQPDWLEAVAEGVNFNTVFTGIQQDGELQSVIPAFLAKRGPFNLYGSPLRGTLTSTLGPVSRSPIDQEQEILDIFEETNKYAREQWGVQYSRFTLPNVPSHLEHALKPNWEEQQPGSYWLELTDGVDAVWERLKKDCRRNIRKAQNSAIEIVPLTDPEFYYQLVEQTYQRHGSSSWHPKEFFQQIMGELIPKGPLWAWGAKYQDEIIAACLFLHDDQQVHFISGASNPQFGNLPTSYILHWHAIQTAIKDGLKVYHTNRSGVESIDHFKEAFNPVLQDRFTLIWSPIHVRYAQTIFLFGSTTFRKLKSIAKTTSRAFLKTEQDDGM